MRPLQRGKAFLPLEIRREKERRPDKRWRQTLKMGLLPQFRSVYLIRTCRLIHPLPTIQVWSPLLLLLLLSLPQLLRLWILLLHSLVHWPLCFLLLLQIPRGVGRGTTLLGMPRGRSPGTLLPWLVLCPISIRVGCTPIRAKSCPSSMFPRLVASRKTAWGEGDDLSWRLQRRCQRCSEGK